jgi:energy-coupling factor transporter ATP-binding protein EcfA2
MSHTLEEIASIINDAFGETDAKKAEPEPEVMETTTMESFETTEWEASRWDNVEVRTVNAREIFGSDVPAVGIKQYRGFETYGNLDVPTLPAVYVPNTKALATLVLSCASGLKAMLVGDTGSGKTSLCEFFAAKLGRPFFRIQFDEFMDDQKLIGSLEVRQEEGASVTYFNKAELVRSMDYPAITAMDEFSRGPSHVTMLANPILDRGTVSITNQDEKVSVKVCADDDWMVVGTDNTNGSGDDMDLYNSSNVLDEAIRNRFDLYVRVPYAPETVERDIITQLAGDTLSSDDIRKLAHFSAMCHKGYSDRKIRTAFSIRNLIAIVALCKQGTSITQAIGLNFQNRVSKSEQPDIAEMVRAIWGA